jgi:UDP-N-acetylmuramoylalanine--D-glutamate ligase
MKTTMFNNKQIGIWGFGKVGKSITNYLLTQKCNISIMDRRASTEQEKAFICAHNIHWYTEKEQDLFFNSCELIIPSPGINISQTCYATHKNKWLTELDAFQQLFHKPIIAITGSIGKTSTTHILGQLFKELSISTFVGGNIGIPTFDIITNQNNVDYAIVELSSFQLMHCTAFAPKLALWTNFHLNHLDHHPTELDYFLAKQKILDHQQDNTLSLIPYSLRDKIPAPSLHHIRGYCSTTKPTTQELLKLLPNERAYYVHNEVIMCHNNGIDISLMPLNVALKNLSFIDNIILIVAACHLLNLDYYALQKIAHTVQLPEHRIEHVASHNNIDFYNDSKATTTASTLAAVTKLSNRPLHLFIGGLSKGVDRTSFIAQLKNYVKHIYCFGKEAQELYAMCMHNNITATQHSSLDDATDACFTSLQAHDCVLLSPAGNSYDLYNDYEERGNHFKKLVAHHIQKQQSS